MILIMNFTLKNQSDIKNTIWRQWKCVIVCCWDACLLSAITFKWKRKIQWIFRGQKMSPCRWQNVHVAGAETRVTRRAAFSAVLQGRHSAGGREGAVASELVRTYAVFIIRRGPPVGGKVTLLRRRRVDASPSALPTCQEPWVSGSTWLSLSFFSC